MKSYLFLATALAAAVTTHAAIERTIEKSFSVAAAGTIKLETSGGTITLTPGKEGEVKITAREHIRASSDADADELLKKLELNFDQTGNDVHASAKYASATGFHFGSWPPVSVDFIATVPAAFMSDLHTSGGGITVGDLTGKVYARTSGGSIKLGKIGASVDVRTSGGSIALQEAEGAARLDTSGGNINVGKVSGPADLSTSGGSIKIDSVAQTLQAHTSGGSIHARIAGPLQGDCALSTSGGSVHVTVAKAAAFRLDARTSGGGVDARGLTITLDDGGQGRSKLAGTVNGGGPLLKLRTSGGGIEVRAD